MLDFYKIDIYNVWLYLSTGGVVLACMWFTLNRKVNSKNQLGLFRITNDVAMIIGCVDLIKCHIRWV